MSLTQPVAISGAASIGWYRVHKMICPHLILKQTRPQEDIRPKSYGHGERPNSIFIIATTPERDNQMNIETQIRSVGLKDSFSTTDARARGRRGIFQTKNANPPRNG